MRIRGDSSQARKMLEAGYNTIFLQAAEKCTCIDGNRLGIASEHACHEHRWIDSLHINNGSKINIHTQLQHPLCGLAPLCKCDMWVACSSHLLRRGQVAMECEQPIDLTAFLIGGNEQRDGCVSHSTTREVIDKVDCVVRWVKVMVTGLVHEPADKLLSNHILQVTILVVITYIFNDNQLTWFLVERHPRHNLLHLCHLST